MEATAGRRAVGRRLVLYGVAVLVGAGLVWQGFFYVPPAPLEVRMEAVLAASRDGDFVRARELVQGLYADFGGHLKIQLLEAFLDECQGDLARARGTYARLVEDVPEPAQRRDLLLSVADIDRRLKDSAAANALLEHVTASYGESSRGRQLRVALLLDESGVDAALSEARKMAEEDPGNPHALRLCRQLQALLAKESKADQPVGGRRSPESR